ncbi:MAG: acyltransferase [Anaerolineaceae bacterium]
MTSLTADEQPGHWAGPQSAAAAASRIREFDVMRGTAIILVVYLHSYFSAWDVTPHREVVAMHVIHLFAHTAVPVFFFVSAFLLALDSTPTFRQFASRKLRTILVPLAFWMAASFAYHTWQAGGVTAQLWRSLLLFDISGQFYFLVVLVMFMAGFYFLRRASTATLGWLAIAAFVINLAAIVIYERSTISGDFAVLAYRNPAVWVFFYAFGFYAGRRWRSLDELSALWRPAALALGAIGAGYMVQGEWLGGYPVSYFGLTVFLFSCASLVVYPALVRACLRARFGAMLLRPVSGLSRYAFAIYLVHMPFFVGWLTTELVSDSPMNDDFFKLMNALFVVGFCGSLLFVVTVASLFPRGASVLLAIDSRQQKIEVPAK